MLFIISLCAFFLTKCVNKKEADSKAATEKFNQRTLFAGSNACVSCHNDIVESHKQTAHFQTSMNADEKTIHGNFEKGHNSFLYDNTTMMMMEHRGDSFYQVAYINGIEKKKQAFDLVIGSGAKGQSFASWAGDKLVQMPITWFTSANQWSNSPGYPNKIAFNRMITSRCLECHATYAESISAAGTEPEIFNRNTMIIGVDCEKCHGPAAKHVEFQTANPTEKKAKFIINPALFSRQQSLDLCALCHGGRLQKTTASFSFTAGDRLADFFKIDSSSPDVNSIDVHGNQLGLLKASKCFMMSDTLTCNTCHDPHKNEKNNPIVFSQRCITCHNGEHKDGIVCKMTGTISTASISNNCIGCHMPEQQSRAIAVLLQGQQIPTPALMHTHLIKNYPAETAKVLAFLKGK